MKILSIVLSLSLCIFLFSCGAPFIELTDDFGYTDAQLEKGDTDYSKAYLAIKSVLNEEFGENLVKVNKYPGREHRKFVVYSKQNNVGAGKARMKVVGFVGRDEFSQVTPVFYCTYQVEQANYKKYTTPEPSGQLLGDDVGSKRFIDAVRNESLEADLFNKTMEKLNPGFKKFKGLNNALPSALLAWKEGQPLKKGNQNNSEK